ncbi:MAG: hypothetical protein KatS3mg124_2419 [Porticoccaceae bacterium]|nr:MAG: hypothetical protein KatS3mg124_2419 [Porticoccaceae bacterium]
MLTDAERAFLAARRRRLASWPRVGALLLVGIGALALFLASTAPALFFPDAIRRGGCGVQAAAAAFLPVAVIGWLATVAAGVAIGYAVARRERQYLALIERLSEAETDPPASP